MKDSFFFQIMKDIYFLLQKKFRFLETFFPDINDGIIALANTGSKKLNVPLPLKSLFYQKL